VLIVDDDEMARETLAELVEMAGCSAIVAANGREALQILRARRPRLVILDLVMPVMSGHDLLRVMKAEPALSDIAVVISTSAPQHAPAGVPVISKPVNIASIMDCISRTCR
jgi:two-component system, sensor histidine kinase and response regulator